MKIATWLLGSSLLVVSTAASADLTADYAGPNNAIRMKVEVASNGDVRAATSNPNSYFITRDGRGYVVQASFNGPAVMRMEDMATVMAEQMKKLMPKMSLPTGKDAPAFPLVKGGVVTIRGRQGVAYYVSAKTPRPAGERPVIVISSDPKLAPLGAAMEHQFEMSITMMGQIFGEANPFKAIRDVLKTGAPLVFTGMELDTVKDDPIPAARFVLPAAPLTLDGVRKNMGGAPPS